MTDEEAVVLYRAFRRVWPWLAEALARNTVETHRQEHIWTALESGDAQLWMNDTAAMVTEILTYPTGAKVLNAWLAGGDLEGVRSLVETTEDFAREKGCVARSITGRRGWLRALDGYDEAATVMTRPVS